MSEKVDHDRLVYLQNFKDAPLNSIITLPIDLVKPSQSDDGVRNESQVPVEGCLQENFVLVMHGNHRWYTRKTRGHDDIRVKKVENPYTNW